jgi:hypothetical protein
MAKILLWVIIIAAGMLGLRLLNIAKAKREAGGSRREAPGKPEAESMVQCVRCGVYLPRVDALPSAAGLTCGDPGCAQRPSHES